jgi:hypothetical protein
MWDERSRRRALRLDLVLTFLLLCRCCSASACLFSYFAALAKGDVEAFLEDQSKKKKQADAAAAAAGQ